MTTAEEHIASKQLSKEENQVSECILDSLYPGKYLKGTNYFFI